MSFRVLGISIWALKSLQVVHLALLPRKFTQETFHMQHFFRFFGKIQDPAGNSKLKKKEKKKQKNPIWFLTGLLPFSSVMCSVCSIHDQSNLSQCWSQPEEQTFHFPNVPWETVLMNSTLCCNSTPFFFSLSFSLPPHTHSRWASGVLWVGGLVGGSWGCRAEREGIQCNMHGEITIATLGDLQMLVVQGIVVGSYHSQYKLGNCNLTWRTSWTSFILILFADVPWKFELSLLMCDKQFNIFHKVYAPHFLFW